MKSRNYLTKTGSIYTNLYFRIYIFPFACLLVASFKLMKNAQVALVEPIMRVEIAMPEEYLSPIMKDLSKRRVEISCIDGHGKNKVIHCLVPLAELLGYSSIVRKLSSGHATFSLELHHYEVMDLNSEVEAVKSITGFYY